MSQRVYCLVTRTYGEVSDEIEEEVSLGHADHFVENLHEQTEAFARLQLETIGDVSAEVFRTRGRIDFERFGCIVGKVDFVVDLRGHVLDSFDFDLVRWMFPLTIPASNEGVRMRVRRETTYFNVRCNRAKQSAASWCFLERRKRFTSRRRTALGAKQPVASHMSSQPRDSLA